MRYLLLSVGLLVSLASCNGSSDSGAGSRDAVALFERCENPRPQACTREFVPVCAALADGGLSTFANACTACANAGVAGHYPLSCAAPAMVACTEPRPEVCTANFLPVCGQRVTGGTETFGNACQACGDGSVIGYFERQCP